MGQTKPSPSKGGLLQSKRLVTTNIYEMAAAAAVGVYCASRNAAYKVPVEVDQEACRWQQPCSR